MAARKQLIEEGLDAGAVSVHDRLHAQNTTAVPSEATIYRILVRRGQITPQPAKRPKATVRRFQRDRPNQCWQGDDTHYRLTTGQEVRIINIVDDHSRYNADSLAVANCTSVRVWECFTRAAEPLGLPAEFLNDNGRAWINPLDEAPSVFQAHLVRLGVRHLHSRPYHPQTCGKVERFHQTQRRWLDAHPQAATVAELQPLLDRFGHIYNHERPHRALGRRTPASMWSAQPAASPARIASSPVTRIISGTVDRNGVVGLGRHLSVGVGVQWAHHHLTAIRHDLDLTTIATTTAEIVRELTIDPDRRYQPTGNPRGRRPKV